MDDWEWQFEGANSEETDVAGIDSDGHVQVRTRADQEFRWRDQNPDRFGDADQKNGFTAEISTRILKTSAEHRGIDLEIYDGAGSRYSITITEDAVYWYQGLVLSSSYLPFEGFEAVASGLDNTDNQHVFRMAVRPDRVVQIYRDGKLLGTRVYEYRTPRGAYLIWGAGPGVEAVVNSVSYDLSGPKQPLYGP
jgi:hypothetical protein